MERPADERGGEPREQPADHHQHDPAEDVRQLAEEIVDDDVELGGDEPDWILDGRRFDGGDGHYGSERRGTGAGSRA